MLTLQIEVLVEGNFSSDTDETVDFLVIDVPAVDSFRE